MPQRVSVAEELRRLAREHKSRGLSISDLDPVERTCRVVIRVPKAAPSSTATGEGSDTLSHSMTSAGGSPGVFGTMAGTTSSMGSLGSSTAGGAGPGGGEEAVVSITFTFPKKFLGPGVKPSFDLESNL